MLEPILPKEYLKISFSRNFNDDNIRILTLEPHGERLKQIIERIL